MAEPTAQLNTDLEANLAIIQTRIAVAAAKAGRPANSIELLAVSKGQAAARIAALFSLGQKAFGENYVQELLMKAEACRHLPLRWVYIGALQSNKIAKIVAVAAEVQTLASLKHAAAIARAARELGKTPYPVYIAVNVAPELEPQKNGVPLADLPAFLKAMQQEAAQAGWQGNLAVQGLMAVPPPLSHCEDASQPQIPPHYLALRTAANAVGAGRLSLGMSQDLEVAIYAGSNCLRIGSALLGERQR